MQMTVSATAYCIAGITQSGARTRRGILAADPRVLPLGTVVRVSGLPRRYNGTYTVADTGKAVKGREIDIFISDCDAAKRFGRQDARVRVLRRPPAERQPASTKP
jgi:3D (Asp-Asp-Asp) domain-containing protein